MFKRLLLKWLDWYAASLPTDRRRVVALVAGHGWQGSNPYRVFLELPSSINGSDPPLYVDGTFM